VRSRAVLDQVLDGEPRGDQIGRAGRLRFAAQSSHSVALGYFAVTRQRGDAFALWGLYLSHWAADFITGGKPTWPGGPTVGLGLYGHPVWDCAVECAVIVVAWFAYRRSFGPAIRRRVSIALVPLGLIALQVGFELIQTPEIRAAVRELP
jgi:hypothetical protein